MTNDNELAQWPFAACFPTRGHLENRAGRKHALQAPFRFYGNDGTKFPKNWATVWFDFNHCHRVRLFRGPERQSTFPPNAQRNAFRRRDARQQSRSSTKRSLAICWGAYTPPWLAVARGEGGACSRLRARNRKPLGRAGFDRFNALTIQRFTRGQPQGVQVNTDRVENGSEGSAT